jgi:hypothetical protein
MAQNLAPVTVKLEFLGYNPATLDGFSGASRLYSDTSMTSAAAAHLRVAPDEESLASKWLTASTVSLIRFSYPANAVIDIVLDLVLNDGTASSPATVSSGAVGSIGTVPPSGWVSLGLPSL